MGPMKLPASSVVQSPEAHPDCAEGPGPTTRGQPTLPRARWQAGDGDRAADDEEENMPVSILDRDVRRFGKHPDEPPPITAVPVFIGSREGTEFRGANSPEKLVVRVVGSVVTIEASPSEEHIKLDVRELAIVAQVCVSWRDQRVEWAAYAGDGRHHKFFGFLPFVRFRPGTWEGERIEENTPQLSELRDAADRFAVVAPVDDETFADLPVVHALECGTAERVGLVLRTPRERCVVVTRGSLLLAAQWPSRVEHFGAVARRITRGSWKTKDDTPDGPLGLLRFSHVELDPHGVAIVERAAAEVQAKR